VRLPLISNFDDFEPLAAEPGVRVRFVRGADELDGADLIVLPGSKSTVSDLRWLFASGLAHAIRKAAADGRPVLGVCGGYQMLGRSVADPEGIEGPAGETEGLGLLDVTTVMTGEKTLTRVTAQHVATRQPIDAYEIHIGRTDGPDRVRPFAMLDGAPEGAISRDGRVYGSYLHGLFASDEFRSSFLRQLDIPTTDQQYRGRLESVLDALADHIEAHLDVEGLLALAR
jgi:adenosylcobyric acid synthase